MTQIKSLRTRTYRPGLEIEKHDFNYFPSFLDSCYLLGDGNLMET